MAKTYIYTCSKSSMIGCHIISDTSIASLGGLYKHVSGMLNIKFTLSSGGGLARNIWHLTEIAAITVKSASSANTGLACYGYIIQSTMIDKLSLRLGGGRVLC